MASSPFMPIGLVLLISLLYELSKKYSVSYLMLLMHCSPLFMKQVLPRFSKPHKPSTE